MKRPIAWAKMYYICNDCGAGFDIYLENTLERHNGDKHKPVPFGIRCGKCNKFNCFDRTGVIPLPEEREIRPGEIYFSDEPKYDCGVIRIAEGSE